MRSLTAAQVELEGKVAALESMGMKALAEQDKRSQCEEELRKMTEEKQVGSSELH